MAVVEFVRKWRRKRFCTCRYIRTALKLRVTRRTVANVLNRHGFFWRPLPRLRGFTEEELRKRKDWVDGYLDKTSGWWQDLMNFVLDGVTLTKPPKPLALRERHMAQAIRHMWLRAGEEVDPECHTYNRYGVQLGSAGTERGDQGWGVRPSCPGRGRTPRPREARSVPADRSQSATVGRFHGQGPLLFEALDPQAEDDEGGVGRQGPSAQTRR